jgi:hypothetical protein
LNQLSDLLATEGTSVQVYHLVTWLIGIAMIAFDQLNTLFVARGAAPKVRRVLLHVGSSVADVELSTTG